MMFMHLATGELFELLLLSVEESGLMFNVPEQEPTPAYSVGRFTLFSDTVTVGEMGIVDFSSEFQLIGFL